MVEKLKKQFSFSIDFVTIDTIYKIGRFYNNNKFFPPKYFSEIVAPPLIVVYLFNLSVIVVSKKSISIK